MDNLYFNPRTLATRDEELAILVGNEEQSATTNLQGAWILYYYAAMIPLQFHYIPPLLNMRPLDYNSTTLPLSTRGAQQHVTTPGFTLQGNWRFGRYCGAWLALVATYLGICALLLAYIQLKFQSEPDFTFKTHLGFIILSIAALFMTLFTCGIMVYTNNDLQSLMKDHFSPVCDLILKSVLCFSVILTPLSLLLAFFIPNKFNLIGYLIVFALFLAILAINFKSLKRLLAPKRANNV